MKILIKWIISSWVRIIFLTILLNAHNIYAEPKSGPAADYLKALLNFEPWAESVWKDYPGIIGTGYFGDGASKGNGGIRGNCGIALAYSVLICEFPNAPEYKNRLKKVEAALRYTAETHVSGPDSSLTVDGKKWGVFPGIKKFDPHAWQSPLWAASMGFAAALIEDKLDPKVVESCKRVVAFEADILANIPPASGYIKDSKGEENAWDTNIVTLAASWMPDDFRAKEWLKAAKFYLANTYTVPIDSTGPLKNWIKTQTLYPSYAMENHGFYHPLYQAVAGMSKGDSYLIAQMLNPEVAKEIRTFAEYNVLKVWNFIKNILLDTGELAYPSGLDWSLHCFEHVSYLAWIATNFREPEAQWAQIKLSHNILKRQAINGDGRFVGESCPNGFYREAVEARRIAFAYLQNQISGFPYEAGIKLKEHVTHYPDVGLIVQRTQNELVTLSYGSKIMALVYPLKGKSISQNFFTSPNTSSFIDAEGRAVLKDFKNVNGGFQAELDLFSNNNERKSKIIVESNSESIIFIEIPNKNVSPHSNMWYLMAVENHQFTGGERNILWKENSKIVKERSGAEINTISCNWINIDNWMGFIAEPSGNFLYKAAKNYNRKGAAEDELLFKLDEKDKPHIVIVLPGKNAETTAKIQKKLRLEFSKNKFKIFFPLSDVKVMESVFLIND